MVCSKILNTLRYAWLDEYEAVDSSDIRDALNCSLQIAVYLCSRDYMGRDYFIQETYGCNTNNRISQRRPIILNSLHRAQTSTPLALLHAATSLDNARLSQTLAYHLSPPRLRITQLDLCRHRKDRSEQYPRRVRKPDRANLELSLLLGAFGVLVSFSTRMRVGLFLVNAVEYVNAEKIKMAECESKCC